MGDVRDQFLNLLLLLQSMVKMSRLEAGIIQIKSEARNLYETLTEAVAQIVPAA